MRELVSNGEETMKLVPNDPKLIEDKKSQAFLSGKLPYVEYDDVAARNAMLMALNAKPEAAYIAPKDPETGDTIFVRKTSNEHILAEDHEPQDSTKPTRYKIYWNPNNAETE